MAGIEVSPRACHIVTMAVSVVLAICPASQGKDEQSMNVALAKFGATATASDMLGEEKPDRLIDGIVNHDITNRWHSDIHQARPHRVQIRFIQPFQIDRLVLHATVIDCFPTRLTIECRQAEGQWKQVTAAAVKPARSVIVAFPPVEADAVRITFLATSGRNLGYVQLNEIEVPTEVSQAERAAVEGEMTRRERQRVARLRQELFTLPRLEKEDHRVVAGSWAMQGYPFYSGRASYHLSFSSKTTTSTAATSCAFPAPATSRRPSSTASNWACGCGRRTSSR